MGAGSIAASDISEAMVAETKRRAQDAEIAELQAALGTATTVSYVAIILAILLGIVSIAMARKK